MMKFHITRVAGAIATTMLCCVVAAGCGSGDDTAEAKASAAANASPELVALLPDRVAEAGAVTYGTEANYPPFQLHGDDGKEVEGLSVDLGRAAAELLGLSWKVDIYPFDSLIPSLLSKRFDLILEPLGDFAERREQVNFVDLFRGGTLVYVAKGNPAGIADEHDVCGHSLGVAKGSDQVPLSEDLQAQCEKDGKQSIDVKVFESQNDQLMALRTGRLEAIMMYSPTGDYVIKTTDGAIEGIGDMMASQPGGFAFRKEDQDLAKAYQAAVQELIDNGTYAEILEKWGASRGAVPSTTINDGHGF